MQMLFHAANVEERHVRIEEGAIAEAAARLDPKVASLEALAGAALPAPETIARFRKSYESAARLLERTQDEARGPPMSCRCALPPERGSWCRCRPSVGRRVRSR